MACSASSATPPAGPRFWPARSVPANLPRGPADFDSEGLLLLDRGHGGLAHRLADAAVRHQKTYLVQVERIPGPDALQRCKRIKELRDGLDAAGSGRAARN